MKTYILKKEKIVILSFSLNAGKTLVEESLELCKKTFGKKWKYLVTYGEVISIE